MRNSCFASESCGRNSTPDLRPSSLLQHKYAYVALDEHDQFLGCISADPARPCLPNYAPDVHCECDEALLVFNLCVVESCRKQGIGKLLLRSIVEHAPGETYLLVARWGLNHPRHDVHTVFVERIERLLATYERQNFAPVTENDVCTVMKVGP